MHNSVEIECVVDGLVKETAVTYMKSVVNVVEESAVTYVDDVDGCWWGYPAKTKPHAKSSIALFTVNCSHLYYNVIQRGCENIKGRGGGGGVEESETDEEDLDQERDPRVRRTSSERTLTFPDRFWTRHHIISVSKLNGIMAA